MSLSNDDVPRIYDEIMELECTPCTFSVTMFPTWSPFSVVPPVIPSTRIGCVIDARASAGMSLLHVIGPAEATHRHDDVDKEAEQTSMAAARTAEGKPAKMTSTSFDGQE